MKIRASLGMSTLALAMVAMLSGCGGSDSNSAEASSASASGTVAASTSKSASTAAPTTITKPTTATSTQPAAVATTTSAPTTSAKSVTSSTLSSGTVATTATAQTVASTQSSAATSTVTSAKTGSTDQNSENGNKAVTLTWLAPTENTDGSALTNLSGYVIYYGATADTMTNKVAINTVGISTYMVTSLNSGTYYFAVVAVNSVGEESALSDVATASI